MITFANNVDPDQDQQNVGTGLDPNCLTLSVPDSDSEMIFGKCM